MKFSQKSGFLLLSVAVLLATAITGCGKPDPLNRQAVFGEIALNGTPLPDGTIEFSPVGSGTSSGAVIQAGKFAISAEKGLPPGDYVVRISAADAGVAATEMPGESNILAAELIPPRYNSESDVKFTVKADQENVFTLDVQGG